MKVKEESEKVGLTLNTQKTKIMASVPITSWQIDGEQWLTLFFRAPKSLQMVIANSPHLETLLTLQNSSICRKVSSNNLTHHFAVLSPSFQLSHLFISTRPAIYLIKPAAAAAAESHQSCPTLCEPIDSSPPGSSVPGILQARTLEWVAISLSNLSSGKLVTQRSHL